MAIYIFWMIVIQILNILFMSSHCCVTYAAIMQQQRIKNARLLVSSNFWMILYCERNGYIFLFNNLHQCRGHRLYKLQATTMMWRMTKFFTYGVYTCRLKLLFFATTKCNNVQYRSSYLYTELCWVLLTDYTIHVIKPRKYLNPNSSHAQCILPLR